MTSLTPTQPTMIPPNTPQRTQALLNNLQTIRSRITTAAATATAHANNNTTTKTTPPTTQIHYQNQPLYHIPTEPPPPKQTNQPRLVAVSKLKPAADILTLHNAPATPQLHFGENYVQELLEKSRLLPPTIRWHFIGGLQSNKCLQLARDVRGLWAVESVDSIKKADLLNRGWQQREDKKSFSEICERNGVECEPGLRRVDEEVEAVEEEGNRGGLRVFVQVNTSGEPNKSGVDPGSETTALCHYILANCHHLYLSGLMTIGAIARSKETRPGRANEDFVCLKETRDRVVKELGLGDGLELSMGMSEDFEGAIALGSDQVRVGSTIFGARPPRSEARII